MSNMVIRNIDDQMEQALRIQASRRGNSIEEEAKELLLEALRGRALQRIADESAGAWLGRIKEALGGGDELELPSRSEWNDRPLDLGQ